MSFAAFDTTTWYHMRYHETSEDDVNEANAAIKSVNIAESIKKSLDWAKEWSLGAAEHVAHTDKIRRWRPWRICQKDP